ncbi:hypothetical protein JW887_04865 [Candidatus Dojkabacteria bacterium]|nr:hypothetical protein [Candidatus Dojkabacteria bacterium]
MKNYIDIPQTNILVDIVLIVFLMAGFFINFNKPVQALVKKYTAGQISAEFHYPRYTKENKVTLEIDAYGVNEIYLDGLTAQNKINVGLNEGDNIFIVRLVGKKETQEYEIVITKDTKPPTIVTPTKKTINIAQNVNINFTVSEPLSFFKFNENDCSRVTETEFSCVVTQGKHEVIFSDFAGNEVEESCEIVRDNEPPKILSDIPKTISQIPYQLRLKVSPDTESAWINTKEIDLVSGHIFFELNKINNEITVKLKDEAGNEAEYTYNIIYKKPTQTDIVNPNNDNATTTNPTEESSSNEGSSEPNNCYSQTLVVTNIKSQVFVGETQTTTVILKCLTTGRGIAGKSVSIVVGYSDGTTNTYTGTTNASGIANFSWTTPNKKGGASVTGKYEYMQTSASFTVY